MRPVEDIKSGRVGIHRRKPHSLCRIYPIIMHEVQQVMSDEGLDKKARKRARARAASLEASYRAGLPKSRNGSQAVTEVNFMLS